MNNRFEHTWVDNTIWFQQTVPIVILGKKPGSQGHFTLLTKYVCSPSLGTSFLGMKDKTGAEQHLPTILALL